MRRQLALASVVVTLVGALGVAATPLTVLPAMPGGHFIDDNGNLHEANIEAIAARGITLGCNTEGTAYCPGAALNRAQMASLLARAFELPPSSADFIDVSDANVHGGSIGALADAEITLGCAAGPDRFCPWDPVSRGQMASFLARALDLSPDPSINFDDVDEASAHGRNITAIAAAGITLGCNAAGSSFCPEATVTRSQMASFLARALQLPIEEMPIRIDLLPPVASCEGEPRDCTAALTTTSDSGYYVLEGFFYQLPYLEGDASSFAGAEFRLFIDGNEVTGIVEHKTTTFGTTVLRLGGWVFDELGPGTYDFLAEWWWEDNLLISAAVEVTITN